MAGFALQRLVGALLPALLVVLGGHPRAMGQGVDAVEIDAGVAQLFVDDYLIASQEGLERRLHCPVKDANGDEAVMEADGDLVGRKCAVLDLVVCVV